MPTPFVTIAGTTLPTFTVALAAAVLVGAGLLLRRVERPAALADALLLTLLGALLGARLAHVMLNWDYFNANVGEILNLRLGGLDWHGAVIGGLAGLRLGALLRRPSADLRPLLDTFALLLPLLGAAAWYGCAGWGCGYGREVATLADYPPWAAAESQDVFGIVAPRLNTAFFGGLLCAVVLLVALGMAWRGWMRGRRFWCALALLSAGMFVIGFLRGDHTLLWLGLRADQCFDLGLGALSVYQIRKG
ncbi:MAG: prolipoprotein diacylglyceryl transferase [Anaerolineae bacterium]|nr:prolipoprotein diacylglyceryl transferase [Anaerolineae bacterium]